MKLNSKSVFEIDNYVVWAIVVLSALTGSGCKKTSAAFIFRDTIVNLTFTSNHCNLYPGDSTYLFEMSFVTSTRQQTLIESPRRVLDLYKIQFIYQGELMDTVGCWSSAGQLAARLNPRLLGKPLFVITDIETGAVYDTGFASPKDVLLVEQFCLDSTFSPTAVCQSFDSFMSFASNLTYSGPVPGGLFSNIYFNE
jgi:hypothetical protein